MISILHSDLHKMDRFNNFRRKILNGISGTTTKIKKNKENFKKEKALVRKYSCESLFIWMYR